MCKKNLVVKEPAGRDWDGRRTYLLSVSIPGHPIDGNWWSENQSINRYQSIKLIINWYRLVLVNGWSINNYKKKRSLITIDEHGNLEQTSCTLPVWSSAISRKIWGWNWYTIQTQSSQCKEYTLLHKYSNHPLARHCLSMQEVREKALLNIRCIVRGYHLCRFEVNAGEVFTAWGGRGGTAIYGLYRYVPLWRVWFSSSLL